MLYWPFIVRTDNNPFTCIMTTPNLDATGYQWVGALVRFSFQLEYQKGWDNTMADLLSCITTHLSPEAVWSILDGVTLGAAHRAKGCDPTVVETDHNIEEEVCVATEQVSVEMHVTNWAVWNWLEARKKTDLKTLLGEHASSEEGQLVWWNCQNFTTCQNALYLHSMPKGENEDLLLFVVPKAHRVAALNGCHCDASHQGCEVPYPYYKNAFGGQGWPTRCDKLLVPAHAAYSMRAASPRPLYIPSWLLLLWISCMLTLPA